MMMFTIKAQSNRQSTAVRSRRPSHRSASAEQQSTACSTELIYCFESSSVCAGKCKACEQVTSNVKAENIQRHTCTGGKHTSSHINHLADLKLAPANLLCLAAWNWNWD
ncbi:hypothetical protein AcV7_002386 [Taiwanofungus camphoratus]|nr:hypothetical protein AcV7_002386 [Antrodia cinnamomea]